MSVPTIPQRPARSQQASGTPQVPPRPGRSWQRSQSPNRESYTRSPLNDSPFAAKVPSTNGSTYTNDREHAATSYGRPPSVSQLPLIGQEGNEYASFYQSIEDATNAAPPVVSQTQTRNVAGDLPLHAPIASLTPSSARTMIAPVTRTDSTQAASVGIGKPKTEYEGSEHSARAPSIGSARRRSEQPQSPELFKTISRPESIHDPEHELGIPEIGLQVPMYPNAGDVQAPSPAPSAPLPTGVGFFNDGSRTSTHHARRKSAAFGPPGSYGLHAHGVSAQDQFEKAWYQKHPEELMKEQEGAYGPGMASSRGQWALSSEELNKLVQESRGPGFGTSPRMVSTPSEQIGYMASEEYASRIGSPRPPSLHLNKSRRQSRTLSGTHAESPLRKASFPHEIQDSNAIDSEADDDAVHVDPPAHRTSKIGGGGYDPPTEDLGPLGGNSEDLGGWIHERGAGTPILASDELAKDPAAEYLQPAISPEQEKTGDDNYFAASETDATPPYVSGLRNQSRSRSRPRDRPSSTHGTSGLSRFVSHGDIDGRESAGTPLEDVAEYEPLFDSDEEQEEKKRPLTAADRLKRPEMDRRRFPSQDIWEDTPDSLQLSTTVSGPQEPEELRSPDSTRPVAASFEPPEKELARKGEVLESERLSFLNDPSKGYAKPKFNAGLQLETEGRPGMRQRFPSRDIWEDTPESQQLETTIDPSESTDVTSPITGQQVPAFNSVAQGMQAVDPALTAPVAKPSVPARPSRSKPDAIPQTQPTLPTRPPQRLHQVPPADAEVPLPPSVTSPVEGKAPGLPERPKPQVPPRPAKMAQDKSSDDAPSTSPTLDKSVVSPPIPKAKPAVPSRLAANSKFAALQAGFMNDLNSRLQMGPQAPKAQPQPDLDDKEEDKAPLADARKGRARGPARRKPAETAEPTETAEPAGASAKASFSISQPVHSWSIDPSAPHYVMVGQSQIPRIKSAADFGEAPRASPLARNTAGEALLATDEAPLTASGALAHKSSADMDARAQREEAQAKERIASFVEATIGHPGDVPEPVVDQPLPASEQRMVGGDAGVLAETLESKYDAPTEPLLENVQPEPVGVGDVAQEKEDVMPGGFPTGVKVEDVEQGIA